VVFFLDGVLIYSASWEKHVQLGREVFQALTEQQLEIKMSKCKFSHGKLAFHGHEISAEGV
jgi:hypothetical protein